MEGETVHPHLASVRWPTGLARSATSQKAAHAHTAAAVAHLHCAHPRQPPPQQHPTERNGSVRTGLGENDESRKAAEQRRRAKRAETHTCACASSWFAFAAVGCDAVLLLCCRWCACVDRSTGVSPPTLDCIIETTTLAHRKARTPTCTPPLSPPTIHTRARACG